MSSAITKVNIRVVIFTPLCIPCPENIYLPITNAASTIKTRILLTLKKFACLYLQCMALLT